MSADTDNRQIVADDVVVKGGFKAQVIDDHLTWGVGSIQPDPSLSGQDQQRELLEVVLGNLKPVEGTERAYSSCTDGRAPVRLQNGEPVPVREQIVGADIMLVFHMAEVLGPRFYKDPNAPLADRLNQVVVFVKSNGLMPSTHIGCGAAAAYVIINQNLINFVKDGRFIARQKLLLPEGVYSDELREQINRGYQQRLEAGSYKDWSDALVTETVTSASDDRSVAELKDDGRGVHGHVEEQIIRIKADYLATDEAAVIAATGGREVFSVNDNRMRRLAELMGRGHDEDYRMALMAAEDFTDAGHGTLAKNLPTYIVTLA